MNHKLRFTSAKIAQRIALIEPMAHAKRQPIDPFRMLTLPDAKADPPLDADFSDWDEIPHESYWGGANVNFLMMSEFQVPDGWDPDHLALHLPLGVFGDIFNHPEALVHIDGRSIGSADRYHHTIALSHKLADGKPHRLGLHGWTGHTNWPPDAESRAKLFMGVPRLIQRHQPTVDFIRLARCVWETVNVLTDEAPERDALLDALDRTFLRLDTHDPMGAAFYDTVPPALEMLQQGIAEAGAPLDVTLHGIGHAHMDIAYLWPISQIRRKNARTYSNVLRLMDRDPEFRFSHSQPQLYAMTAEDHPGIFERMRARIAEGRWEVMGGMWVEPDLNMPGPEALVRQLVLGRRYFMEQFGDVETPVLWLPDTFGFPGQIPQLMKQAGLRWFVTNKLNWNQINRVPSSTHWWDGLDGSRVLAHILTTPRQVQYLPFPTNYKSDLTASEVLGTWTNSTAQDHVQHLPICFGYGDGGGGPTEELLAKARAYQRMPGMPRMRHSNVRETFETIEASAQDLPVWRGEHYMEGHRGVLTSQAWIKRANRKSERALHEVEALAAMAGIQPNLTRAWQLLCLNQFHDILTGTSIPEVFDDARLDHAEIGEIAEGFAHDLSGRLVEPGADAMTILNTAPLAADRLAVVTADAPLPGQDTRDGRLVYLPDLPAYSISDASTVAAQPPEGLSIKLTADGAVMENALIRVEIDGNGQLARVYDKSADREVLAAGQRGNQLQSFEDRPICWDAWDIDPFFEERMEVIEGNTTLTIIETGPLRACLQINTTWRQSTIRQDIRLYAHSKRMDFVTAVDWHQSHILLKVAFPVSVSSSRATYDIQWGRIERSTARDSSFDYARFEVPAQKWADLSADGYGVALLNDCKYGYDTHKNMLRLSLIKSATMPDPTADQGSHMFTYSLLPHAGEALDEVEAHAYDLNTPIRCVPGVPVQSGPFVSSDDPSVIIETLKPADDGAGMVVRVFESAGQRCKTILRFAEPVTRARFCDLLEAEEQDATVDQGRVSLDLSPFQIVTLKVEIKPAS
ncbi:alpha-mannosidase [Litoreibacter roseus]|uniref:Alpha-mannosidase n=1 Tax=Litoreibacter roseus TaxID=2601869 RepID=A0A6N6JG73_9RHOB|nr:glycoside hydrolase family 38 C-terminal domain-containing protein [Litoreibacter roseus]GFE64967.1 alpha-mannosidase [Litoreibacter roseus]